MTGTDTPSELQSLRDEVNKLRKEIVDAKVERAAKQMEQMRNWMSFYTPTVTAVFLIFAALGWRGLSDVEAGKARMEAKAVEVEKAAGNIDSTIEGFKAKERDFTTLVNENQNVVSKNKALFSGFQASLDKLEKKENALRDTANKVEGQLSTLSSKVTSTSDLLSTSASLTSGIGSLVSTSLNVPVILEGPTFQIGGAESITGSGFGFEAGKLWVRIVPLTRNSTTLPSPPPTDLSADSDALEFPPDGVTSWVDFAITFKVDLVNSLVARTNRTNVGYGMDFQIQTHAGTKSNVYRVVPPSSPSSLSGSVP
jgi:hypothetical protein